MFKEEDLVRIAKRENNTKRSYLVVNQFQGKHIPVKPSKAFEMFKGLAETFRKEYENEKLLLVGFAETATAIGAAVAVELETGYIQTTREIIPNVEYLFFSEEHSHATEQKLVKDDIESVIGEIDRIVFVEDEVTTGKTILNIITILEKIYGEKLKFSVASLLNGMDEKAMDLYKEKGIRLHYLVKTNHEKYSDIADRFVTDGVYVSCNIERQKDIKEICLTPRMNARRLLSAKQYEKACANLWTQIDDMFHEEWSGKVLVLGTEEFMYPALFVANQIEKQGIEVVCHSTTRSPIAVSSEADYPLHVRYELRSLYDKERVTFLYDIGAYDKVLIVTDAHNDEKEGLQSLVNAISEKNDDIVLIRWC